MVNRGEELSNVESQHARIIPLGPPCAHQVRQVQAGIFGGVLSHPSHLIWINKIILDHVELKVVRNHLLDRFTKGIQEHNWPECLWGRIGWFVWFQDDHQNRVLEMMFQPVTHHEAGIGQREYDLLTVQVCPRNVVRSWSGARGAGLEGLL